MYVNNVLFELVLSIWFSALFLNVHCLAVIGLFCMFLVVYHVALCFLMT